MEYAAITHYGDKRYCFALEKGHFLIRIAVKKGDISRIVLHYRDKYLPLSIRDTRQTKEMRQSADDGYRVYYETDVVCDVTCLRYFFEITDRDGKTVYYSNYVFYDEVVEDTDRMFDMPQNLREEEEFRAPAWAADKVVYQVFPARFASSEPVADEKWYMAPIGRDDRIGGDLRGIIEHLDHLGELGVDVLYMTPVFLSKSVHKYNTLDYYQVDPEFGTKEDLRELVDKAHALGMKVILDGVFNHTSHEFPAFADCAEKGPGSKYWDWYYIGGYPLIQERWVRPNYKTFSYAYSMPKLNLSNPEVQDYVCGIAQYWIRECDIDGWRLDVGDEVGHAFWKKFRRAVKGVKEDALIIGEIWHFAGDFLEGDEWDTVMNYHFSDAVKDLVAWDRISVSEFLGRIGFLWGNLNSEAFPLLWNHLDTHDTERFLHSCGNDTRKQKLGAALQLLFPGMPMIYYGDEYGMQGAQDPDNRRGMVWKPEYQDADVYEWYRRLIRVRKEYPALIRGELTGCETDDAAGLIRMDREMDGRRYSLVFNCGKTEIALKDLTGRRNILADSVFTGVVEPLSCAVLER